MDTWFMWQDRLPGSQWECWSWNPAVLRFSCVVWSTAASIPKGYPRGRFSRGTSIIQYKHWKSQLRHSPHLLCTGLLPWCSHQCSWLLQGLMSGTERMGLIPWDAEFPEPAGRVDGAGSCLGWNLGSPVLPGRTLHQGPNSVHSGSWVEHDHLWIYYSFSNAN